MLSLKDVAQNCLGLSGSYSVNRDLYGYVFRDDDHRLFGELESGDTFPGTGKPTRRSLKAQLELARERSINLSIFLVDHTNDFTGAVTRDDVTKIQYAIQVARDIYSQAPLGIRKIFWRLISPEAAGNYRIIADSAEAEDLTDDFSGPNNGIDVFFVWEVLNAYGWGNSGPRGGSLSRARYRACRRQLHGRRRRPPRRHRRDRPGQHPGDERPGRHHAVRLLGPRRMLTTGRTGHR